MAATTPSDEPARLRAGDTWKWTRSLADYPAGTWTLKLLYTASNGGGIFTVSVDGSSIGTIDSYNGSTTYNNVGTIAGWTVATAGVYALNLKMATKHASSSSYFGFVQAIAAYRTGA
jgi:hypothetical protein